MPTRHRPQGMALQRPGRPAIPKISKGAELLCIRNSIMREMHIWIETPKA
jgi:hypothetical protein